MEQQKNYVPLHVHTEFSLLDGAIKLKDYLDQAKKQGWIAAAITDHGNVFGAVKFLQQAEKKGIKGILGAEMYFTPDVTSPKNVKDKYYHNTLLVKDEKGYSNLCRLMAYSYEKGFYFKPRIDFAALKANSEGLIILSGCQGGLVPSLLLEEGITEEEALQNAAAATRKYIDIVGKENFYFEVMPPHSKEQDKANTLLFKLAKELKVEVVATPDSHYLLPEHNLAHEIMLSVGTKNLITDNDRFTFGDFKGHLKTTQEMLDAFPDNEEVVWNSGKIAEKCNFKFKFGELFFPQYQIPEGFSEETYFRHLCKQGLDRIFNLELVTKELRKTYDDRLEVEMNLIIKAGFVGYFLVVSDFVAWAKTQDIPVGPGRGSGAGSLVAWSLQITNIDPVRYNLLFERFLNPERVSMPDFDIDFCIIGRETVINYVKEKYGHDCVCQIITFGTMAAKGVVKDAARVLGFSFVESQTITDLIPEQLKITLKEAIQQEPLLEKMIKDNPKIKQLFDVCFVLEGVTRHASKHAAGVVISPKPLRDVIPLYIPPKTTELITQYAMTELEAVGFLKMDFLGLKNLSVIKQTVKAIEANYQIKIDLDKLPIDDAATFKLLSLGKTTGVFQFEGSGVTDVMIKLQPDKFEDLIAVNALYRPGPLGSGMVDDFILGRHGKKEPSYLFEELRPVLQETYGVIVYQEQVMKIASVIAGYTLGGADILRRAMGKKKPEEMEKQKSIFLEGAKNRGFDIEKSEKLFDLMAYFAGYGFNKSHSAAYALIAYQTAYLKAHYPKEFVAATLSFETSNPDALEEYLQKAKEVSVKVLAPDINKSEVLFSATENGVLFGLSGIKNVGHACLEEIIKQRSSGPFTSLINFCRRINLRTTNKRVLESLVYSGAFDLLPGNRAQKLAKLDQIIAIVQQEKEQEKSGQIGLFSSLPNKKNENKDTEFMFDDIDELPLPVLLEKEKAALGFYLSSHPIEEFRSLITLLQKNSLLFENKISNDSKKQCLIGLAVSVKIISTKSGKKMSFLNVEDSFNKNIEVVIFPNLFETITFDLTSKGCLAIFGTFEKTGENYKVKAEKIVPCSDFFSTLELTPKIIMQINEELNFSQIEQLRESFLPGNATLSLIIKENEKNIKIVCPEKYSFSMQTLENIFESKKIDPILIL